MNNLKKYVIIILLVIIIVFIGVRFFKKSAFTIMSEKQLTELQTNQKLILQKQKDSDKTIDSLSELIKDSEKNSQKIIEKYYYTKEIINNKIIKDDESINNTVVPFDTIKKYLSNYKFKPYKSSSD